MFSIQCCCNNEVLLQLGKEDCRSIWSNIFDLHFSTTNQVAFLKFISSCTLRICFVCAGKKIFHIQVFPFNTLILQLLIWKSECGLKIWLRFFFCKALLDVTYLERWLSPGKATWQLTFFVLFVSNTSHLNLKSGCQNFW